MPSIETLGLLSEYSYQDSSDIMDLQPGVGLGFTCVMSQYEYFLDYEYGYAAQLWVNEETQEAVVSYRGTSIFDVRDVIGDIAMLTGLGHYQGFNALDFITQVNGFLGEGDIEYSLHLTGHPLGGWLASYVASEYEGECEITTFNAPRMSYSGDTGTTFVYSDPLLWGFMDRGIHLGRP